LDNLCLEVRLKGLIEFCIEKKFSLYQLVYFQHRI